MIVEYKRKSNNKWKPRSGWWDIDWTTVPSSWKASDVNFKSYSIRINKDRQYHRQGTAGYEEAFNKAMTWMKLSG